MVSKNEKLFSGKFYHKTLANLHLQLEEKNFTDFC